jgi:hypothetical protein
MDLTTDFNWRVRLDIRSAVNIPFNRTSESRLPSCYVGNFYMKIRMWMDNVRTSGYKYGRNS